ncbi:hypothetical protein cypCar_00039367 [Cyprinus carpio]|nr:hypothetical protein cypCar_00039367 [Cyprinus carpio]
MAALNTGSQNDLKCSNGRSSNNSHRRVGHLGSLQKYLVLQEAAVQIHLPKFIMLSKLNLCPVWKHRKAPHVDANTKSNLYKHRKSHAHRIKAGMASSREETSFIGPEGGALGDEQEEDTASHGFRLSHSFDDQQAIAAEMRIGPHQRMLRRQPAIEVPIGVDLSIEDADPSSSLKEIELGKMPDRELHLYECEICGNRLKKQDSYTSHRLACMSKSPHGPQSEEDSSFPENQPQIMSYNKAMVMAVRKRKKKEESLEEDPPSPGPTAVSFRAQPPSMLGSIDNQGTPCGLSHSEIERRCPRKEISVIQHTRSFEKQESISMASQEAQPEHEQSQEPKPASISRLIRQPNIQVPEILVTEEPDTEMVSHPANTYTSKESEKVEEFQWPQRSQSLSQLPAEKLPPKKKRLRLAEAAQSSGDSSFESLMPEVSLVVPVRLQTHIPTYAGAMYTTISQILATTQHPVCCTAMVIMGKLEEDKLQRSYLRLPSPNPKSYIPLPLPLEHGAGASSDDSCGQLGAGGSKRMLSPAGSLELSLEAQRHQKRVKEEEVKEEGDKEDDDNKCDNKSQEVHASPPSTPVKVKEEPPCERGEKEKSADNVPATLTQSEGARICIFEGG